MEVIHKVRSILKSNKGASVFWIAFVALSLLVIVSAGYEYIRLQIIAQGTRDGMDAVVTKACTENYARLYDGLREGYSGGYKKDSASWTEDVDSDIVYTILDNQFGTQPDGSGHSKYIGENLEFRISDLSVQMTNTPFAPDATGSEKKFTGNASYTVTVPLSFGWGAIPSLEIPMKTVAGYTAKFP